MRAFQAISLLLLSSIIVCTDVRSETEIIDLGMMEVEGELRRPMIDYISTNKQFDRIIKDTIIMNFYELEKKLMTIDNHDEE